MKDLSSLYAQQTDSIVKQLKDNANKQTSAIFAGALIILSGVLATNALWLASSISAVVGLVFWIKSR
ncbi:MAG: hypothetical protein DSZ19_01980 [Candidatus Thioglobus sp.]|nr:MAG: hypothetical protein DSZ19_01980 [Candidatus Thioglobus sp.]